MSERQKEVKFLKSLILCDDSDQGRQLQERIKCAEKDEKCVRCATYMVGIAALLSLAGLGYSAVFVSEIHRFSSHIAPRIFSALGLASLLCLFLFAGYWLWFRAVSNRVYEDCRRFLRAALETRLQQGAPISTFATVSALQSEADQVYKIETPKSQDDTDFFPLSQAS